MLTTKKGISKTERERKGKRPLTGFQESGGERVRYFPQPSPRVGVAASAVPAWRKARARLLRVLPLLLSVKSSRFTESFMDAWKKPEGMTPRHSATDQQKAECLGYATSHGHLI